MEGTLGEGRNIFLSGTPSSVMSFWEEKKAGGNERKEKKRKEKKRKTE